MPWEIYILSEAGDEVPLGAKGAVVDWIATALPWGDLQSPPIRPAEILETFSEEVRKAFTQSGLEGFYEGDGFTFEFFCSDQPYIHCLHADVRGRGNPMPILKQLCLPKQWVVVNAADNSKVDLSNEKASQWQEFNIWSSRAIDAIRDDDES